MKPKSTLFTLIIAGSLALSGAAHAVVLFSGDFTNSNGDKSGDTLSNASSYLSADNPAITGFSSTIVADHANPLDSGTGDLFTTTDATDYLIANIELGTGHIYRFDFTTSAPIDISDASVIYNQFNSNGLANPNPMLQNNWTLEVFDGGTSQGTLTGQATAAGDGSDTTVNLNGGSGISLANAGTYTLEFRGIGASNDTLRSPGIQNFSVSGTVIPEPSAAMLLMGSLGLLLLVRRRRT